MWRLCDLVRTISRIPAGRTDVAAKQGLRLGTADLTRADDGLLDATAGSDPIVTRTPRELFWRRVRDDKLALTALVFIAILLVIAILAPLVVKLLGAPPPDEASTDALSTDFGLPTGPSAEHYFGVDKVGQDVFSRTIYGARVSLEVAIIGTGLAVVGGTIVGMVAGYYRGWVDTVISRTLDVLLAFPILLLGIGLASACSTGEGCAGGLVQPGLTVVIFVIALATFPYVARIIRGQVLSLREKEFVESARAQGASDRRIILREILPNLVAPIIVYSTLALPQNILFEAALSFLGVGVQPPMASWGQMIADASTDFDEMWWYMFFPGVALVLTVLAFNLVGDGLQDALNPRRRK
jgi:peptide/nickel transport system permease protein